MQEILELAGELAHKMATISLHMTVSPDPKGERRLLEQWNACHQAVAVTHKELSLLADLVAASTCWVVHKE